MLNRPTIMRTTAAKNAHPVGAARVWVVVGACRVSVAIGPLPTQGDSVGRRAPTPAPQVSLVAIRVRWRHPAGVSAARPAGPAHGGKGGIRTLGGAQHPSPA